MPPQSLMPAASSSAWSSGERFGGACTFTVSAEDQARQRDGPREVECARAPARRPCAIVGLARKFCTMTSCTCPWRRCRSRMASRVSTRSASVSPMPIRMPVVNGIAARPPREHAQAQRRVLVGRLVVRAGRARAGAG